MKQIVIEERDGVPIFWCETPGPFTAGVTFRVGAGDETLPIAGITHTVEHLAMFSAMRPGLAANGFVDRLRTLFVIQGTGEEIVSFFDAIFAALQDLPLDRLDLERQVLLTEAESHGGGWLDGHLSLRYGPERQGIGQYAHLGLRNLTPDLVAEWSRTYFVRENAAIWMTRPPPADLTVKLPSGRRNPPVEAERLPGLVLPAVADGPANLVSISSTVPRSFAASIGAGVFGHQIFEALRKDLGLTYQPQVFYEPMTDATALIAFACDCLEQNRARVWTDLTGLLHRFAQEGPDAEHLALAKEQARKAHEDPSFVPPLDPSSVNHLLGSPIHQPAELLEGAKGVSVADVRDVFADLLKRTLFLSPLPDGDRPDASMSLNPYRIDAAPHVAGKTYRLVGALPKKSDTTAGPEGIMVSKEHDTISVPFDRCIAVFREGDGTHHIVDRTGDSVKVRLPRLKDGHEVLHLIETRVNQSKIVPLDDKAMVWRRLEEAIQRDLKRRWVIWEESERAPSLLEGDAEIVKVAEATIGLRAGLLILTDTTLVFISAKSGDDPDVTRIHALNEIESARVGGIGKRDALVLHTPTGKHVFREVHPVARNRELVSLIEDQRKNGAVGVGQG